MLNMKVVEFFKLYNIALGLKFRNSKFTTFYVKFLNKGRIWITFVFIQINLIKFWVCLQIFLDCHDYLYFYILALK
jgi:hypothetical protein